LAVVVRRQRPHVAGLLRALDDAGVPRSVPEGGLSLLAERATGPYILALRWIAEPGERDDLVEPVLASDLGGLSPPSARALVRGFLDVLDGGEEAPELNALPPASEVDAVQVLTAHGTAGLEFDTVIVADAVEGNFPSLSRPEPMFDLTVLEGARPQSVRNRLR